MSNKSTTTITVLISVLLATSAFLVVVTSQPKPQVLLTAEQAITILKESGKTSNMITGGAPSSIQLEYISINWQNYLSRIDYHFRLYVSTTPVGEIKPYWIIDYDDTTIESLGAQVYRRYVVDALTGEVMLSLEGGGGAVLSLITGRALSPGGNDYTFSLQPEAWNQSSPLRMRIGENTSITVTLTAESGYDASLPISVRVTDVPLGYSVNPNYLSQVLKTGGSVSFTLTVFTPVPYPPDFWPPPTDPHPHFNIEVSFHGQTDSYPVYIVPSNR